MAHAPALESLDTAVREAFFELVARVAHDLNNHLATILGKAEIAMMVDEPRRWRRGLEDGWEAGQRARVAVADLQRIHGWIGATAPEPAPLSEVLELARRLAGRALARLSIEPLIVERSGAIVPDPAPWTLALWQVITDRARRCEGRPAGPWSLESSRDAGRVVVSFRHPGCDGQADGPAESGGRAFSGGLREARSLVEAGGGRLEIAPEITRLELPS